MFHLKRVYEEPSAEDGYRILVERLWPRGLSKERAAVDLWLKDVAPSPELRKWFNHDPARPAKPSPVSSAGWARIRIETICEIRRVACWQPSTR